LYREYIKAPDITRQRIYLETMQSVIPRLEIKSSLMRKGIMCCRFFRCK